MSASTVLSLIAPVAGAAPSPSPAAGEDVSVEFAAMVTEAGAGANDDGAESGVAVPQTGNEERKARRHGGQAQRVDRATLSPDLAVEALQDVVDGTARQAAQTIPAEVSQPVAPDGAVEAQAEAQQAPQAAEVVASGTGEAVPAQIAVVAPPPPVQAAAVAETAALSASAAPPALTPQDVAVQEIAPAAPTEAEPAQPQKTDAREEPTLPAQASDTARAAVEAAQSRTAPQPPKAEPARMAAAAREERRETDVAPASDKAAPSAKPASDPAAAAAPPPQTAPRAAESAIAPARGAEALKPLPAADTPATAVSGDPQSSAAPTTHTPAATSASSLSRATIETTIQIAARIVRQLEAKQTRFDMVLTPEDLGRVEVSLDIDADGQLAARLAFDNPAAAADLRARADELRRQLTDAGFQLAGDSLEFSERDASAFSGGFERGQNRAFSFAGGKRLGDQADLAAAAPAAWINLSLTPDRVDMRV